MGTQIPFVCTTAWCDFLGTEKGSFGI